MSESVPTAMNKINKFAIPDDYRYLGFSLCVHGVLSLTHCGNAPDKSLPKYASCLKKIHHNRFSTSLFLFQAVEIVIPKQETGLEAATCMWHALCEREPVEIHHALCFWSTWVV